MILLGLIRVQNVSSMKLSSLCGGLNSNSVKTRINEFKRSFGRDSPTKIRYSLDFLEDFEKSQINSHTLQLKQLENAKNLSFGYCEDYLRSLQKNIDQCEEYLSTRETGSWDLLLIEVQEKLESLSKKHKKNVEMFEKIRETVVNAVEPTTGEETTVEPRTVKPATVDPTIEALNSGWA